MRPDDREKIRLILSATCFGGAAVALSLLDAFSSTFSGWMAKHVVLTGFVTSAIVLASTVIVISAWQRRKDRKQFDHSALLAISTVANADFLAAMDLGLQFSSFGILRLSGQDVQAAASLLPKAIAIRDNLSRECEQWRVLVPLRGDVRTLYEDHDRLMNTLGGAIYWLQRYGIHDADGQPMTAQAIGEKNASLAKGFSTAMTAMHGRTLTAFQARRKPFGDVWEW